MASIGMLESIPEAPSDGREVGMDNPLTATVSGSSALFVERMVILGDAAESLLCKLYELYTMQDYLASGFPKLSELLVKKFPQHPSDQFEQGRQEQFGATPGQRRGHAR